ncbi:Rad52/Rad22 family DNA repair protein [Paenibacillus alvei]|uniref:Rad52/Rad22 family DNA repair protein n=1 Tax=Paenibacillus alvei TaxID=44250 RepID=UPI00028964E3|nr:Rad52/Rad22 family DNA repair protein [Paenibacillus alvei]EJW14840.1 Rad52/22 double-strand break repair protein [Paenibacillus alvei DSM 29]MCY9543706.1 Rad52/Rad22 family DNA repair protein [Paenibacillus alvei]MCY9708544.1 Rad52/Rad22 family DNA repair protein [Paenibacillus alvei]MEC0083245.1 Rad52/Rad22 family DNA repair protein [Paenibacillus alvei]
MINGKTVEQVMAELAEPFPPEDIEWRVGSTNGGKTKGIALAYVTNRAIMNRLDSVVGAFNWQNNYREWKGHSQLCGIGIRFGEDWIWKWDGADDSQTEAVKGGLSDSMKRAGYQWGIGRYLYKLENVWVPIEPIGKSYRLAQTPKLPQWALPTGYTGQQTNTGNKTQRSTQKTQGKQENNSPSNNDGGSQQSSNDTGTQKRQMTEKQKQRWEVVRLLKAGGLDDAQAQAWIDKQKEQKRDYKTMLDICQRASKR